MMSHRVDRIVPVVPVLSGALDSFNGQTSIVLQYTVMLKPWKGLIISV